MSNNTELPITAADLEAAVMEQNRRKAEVLLEQLSEFADSIAADSSGDDEFDVELRKSLYISRACLLRWLAINTPRQKMRVSKASKVVA